MVFLHVVVRQSYSHVSSDISIQTPERVISGFSFLRLPCTHVELIRLGLQLLTGVGAKRTMFGNENVLPVMGIRCFARHYGEHIERVKG